MRLHRVEGDRPRAIRRPGAGVRSAARSNHPAGSTRSRETFAALPAASARAGSTSSAAPPTTSAWSSRWRTVAPPVYYLVDYAAKKADIINELSQAGASSSARCASSTTRRATSIALTAYLTLPPGADGEKSAARGACRMAAPSRAMTRRLSTGWRSSSRRAATRCCSRSSAARPDSAEAHRRRRPAPVGPAHAGRCHRWRAGTDRAGHRRSASASASSARAMAVTPRSPARRSRRSCMPAPSASPVSPICPRCSAYDARTWRHANRITVATGASTSVRRPIRRSSRNHRRASQPRCARRFC